LEERITLFAEILLPLPLPKVYTYRLPYEWNELLVIGMRVAVPFGVKKVYSGIVWKITEQPPEGYQANYIIEILDDRPIVTPLQMEFWEWISRYYLSNLGDVLNVALPAGYRVQSQSKISLHPEINLDDLGVLDEKENLVISLLIKEKIITVEQVQQLLNQKTVIKTIKSMYQKGLISMQEELRENYKPKWLDWVELSSDWKDDNFANEVLNYTEKRALKQFEALMHLLGRARAPHPLKQFVADTGVSRTTLNSLQSKGWVRIFQEKTDHLKLRAAGNSHLELTSKQNEIAEKVNASFDKGLSVFKSRFRNS
jgi:primosomal protein N' (replication factor Y)